MYFYGTVNGRIYHNHSMIVKVTIVVLDKIICLCLHQILSYIQLVNHKWCKLIFCEHSDNKCFLTNCSIRHQWRPSFFWLQTTSSCRNRLNLQFQILKIFCPVWWMQRRGRMKMLSYDNLTDSPVTLYHGHCYHHVIWYWYHCSLQQHVIHATSHNWHLQLRFFLLCKTCDW